jgi:signal peptidase II
MPSPFRSPLSLICFGFTAAGGIALDLWVKAVSVDRLQYAFEPYRFIPGWLEFECVRNHGAVFGLGQGQQVLFLIVSVAAIAFLIFLFATSGRKHGYQILLGMLLAGVIGNMYDRLRFGYVRDMIHALPRWPHLFPWVFNIADSLLCVGVGLMVIHSLLPTHETHRGKDGS